MDMGKIRDQDRPYVHEVVQYLRANNLEVELKGSAVERDDYDDIDILATGKSADLESTLRGFRRMPELCTPEPNEFPKTAADDQEYRVEHTGGIQRYMNVPINERVKIEVGETKIDIGLKSNELKWPLNKGRVNFSVGKGSIEIDYKF